MNEPRNEAPDSSARKRPDDRLESWKEIAAYLGRGITTAQRWEQEEALPVRRLPHAKKGSVFAFKSELDAWRAARALSGPLHARTDAEPAIDQPPVAQRSARLRLGRGLVLVSLGLVGLTVAALGLTSRIHRGPLSTTGAEAPITPRPFANEPGAEGAPSFSPDGTRVVYHWRRDGVADLYIKPVVVGGRPQQLTNANKDPARSSGYPKWSPRGDHVAFVRREQEQIQGLYLISPDGGPVRRLTSMAGIALSWTPDGRALAFVDRNSTGDPFSIFQISIDTGERRRLTTPPESAFGDTLCAYSPDGRRLAVVRFGTRYESDLWVMPVDTAGNGPDRLTVDWEGIQGLDWTPDGQAIVFGTHCGLWKILASPAARPSPVLVPGTDGGAGGLSFSRPTSGRDARLVYQWQTRDVNLWRWEAGDGGQGTMKKFPGSTWWEDFPAIFI